MTPVLFTYKGKSYKGFIEASTGEYPYFYWCFLDEPELIEAVGDCLSFKMKEDGRLMPTQPYPAAYQELVELVRGLVNQYIQAGKTA